MTVIQTFSVIHFVVILFTTIYCFYIVKRHESSEIKFLHPFCILNTAAVFILGAYEFVYIPISIVYLTMVGFAFAESFFLPNYIASIIGSQKVFATPIIICSLSIVTSLILHIDISSIIYLTSNIYISYYVCRYFVWLFKQNASYNLATTRHYWIIMGICACYSGSISYWISGLVIFNYGSIDLYTKISNTFFEMYILINIGMYLLFLKAFTCTKPFSKSLSGQF